MFLHGKKRLGKKGTEGWRCDIILVHLKEFAPNDILNATHPIMQFIVLHSRKPLGLNEKQG